jgi:hypothetical protein
MSRRATREREGENCWAKGDSLLFHKGIKDHAPFYRMRRREREKKKSCNENCASGANFICSQNKGESDAEI